MMKHRMVLAAAILVIIFLTYTDAEALEEIHYVDLAQLELRVANAEMPKKLSSGPVKLSASEGWKLVVVELAGTADKSGSLFVGNLGFGAVHSKGIEPARGIALKQKGMDWIWYLSPSKTEYKSVMYILGKGSFSLKLVFTLPEDIGEFYVTIPTFAKGKVVLGAK